VRGHHRPPSWWAITQSPRRPTFIRTSIATCVPRGVGVPLHVEAGLRWTVFPGTRPSRVHPRVQARDSDRMSGRISCDPRLGRPGLAVRIEDAFGTRRIPPRCRRHPIRISGLPALALGYLLAFGAAAPLDSSFGPSSACDRSPYLRSMIPKWNAGLGLEPLGIRARITARHAVRELRRQLVGRTVVGARSPSRRGDRVVAAWTANASEDAARGVDLQGIHAVGQSSSAESTAPHPGTAPARTAHRISSPSPTACRWATANGVGTGLFQRRTIVSRSVSPFELRQAEDRFL
jgi:hypothetical protein